MNYLYGFNFGWSARSNNLRLADAFRSIDTLSNRISVNTITLCIDIFMPHANVPSLKYNDDHTLLDTDLLELIKYIQQKNLYILLKPVIRTSNNFSRKIIDFSEQTRLDTWFSKYQKMILHYAQIAQKTKCEGFYIGCELTELEKHQEKWFSLIDVCRKTFSGLLGYNQNYEPTSTSTQTFLEIYERNLDYIALSCYIPMNDLALEMQKIHQLFQQTTIPIIIGEIGCPSRATASQEPWNYSLKTEINLFEQQRYFLEFFKWLEMYNFVNGVFIWEWPIIVYSKDRAKNHSGFSIYLKPSEKIIKEKFKAYKLQEPTHEHLKRKLVVNTLSLIWTEEKYDRIWIWRESNTDCRRI
ncbi:MAG: glycoside hydrolase family 113 [Mycoplasmatales bacterium]